MARRKKERVARRSKVESGISFENWESMSPQEFHIKRTNAQQYYYQEWTGKALVDYVYTWMAKHGFTKQDIEKAKRAKGLASIPENVGAWCKVLDDGCPDFNVAHITYMQSLPGYSSTNKSPSIIGSIHEACYRAINSVKDEPVAEEKKAVTINVHQRVRNSTYEYCKEIDEWLDGWFDNPRTFKTEVMDVLKFIQEKNLSAVHTSIMKKIYSPELDDVCRVLELRKHPTEDDMDVQLLEAYEHAKTVHLEKYALALTKIVDACALVKEKKRVQRKPRKKKAPDLQKLESKIKYMKSHDAYKIVSVPPLDIVGANEVWVFNTKTRMLGHYFANDMQTLAIKGTTIQNYNEGKSVEKKLRKPEEQLKAFKESGKVALRTFMEKIRAKEGKLRGRLNKDIVIMKVIK